MSKLRYNRNFKQGLIGMLLCVLLFGSCIAFFVVSKIQYDSLVSDMESLEATIVDIDLDIHVRGPSEQEIYIEYEVDGVTYNRELETDTSISFSPGRGAYYSVGDKIEIFYDPQNPNIIASPRSIGVGSMYLVISSIGLALVLFVLIFALKNHRKALVTQEEYEREGEQRKKARLERRELKKKKRAEASPFVKIMRIVLMAFGFVVLLGILLTCLVYY